MIGNKGEAAMLKHGGSQVGNNGMCLHVQVPQHLIRLPMAKETDHVRVNVATEQSHGTTGVEQLERDILGLDAIEVTKGHGHGVEFFGEMCRGDSAPKASRALIGVERVGRWVGG